MSATTARNSRFCSAINVVASGHLASLYRERDRRDEPFASRLCNVQDIAWLYAPCCGLLWTRPWPRHLTCPQAGRVSSARLVPFEADFRGRRL